MALDSGNRNGTDAHSQTLSPTVLVGFIALLLLVISGLILFGPSWDAAITGFTVMNDTETNISYDNSSEDILFNETEEELLNISSNTTDDILDDVLNGSVIEEVPDELNATLNLSEEVPYNFSQTDQVQEPPSAPRSENLSEFIMQGPAKVGEPVAWIKLIEVNRTVPYTLHTNVPADAENIAVFHAPLGYVSPVEQGADENEGIVHGRCISPGCDILPSAAVAKGLQAVNNLSYLGAVVSDADSLPPITGFAGIDRGEQGGLFDIISGILSKVLGFTGAAVIDQDSLRLLTPENMSEIGWNSNFIFESSVEFDSCTFFLDGFRTMEDELVLEGLNFFELRGMAEGRHEWYVSCKRGDQESATGTRVVYVSGSGDVNQSSFEAADEDEGEIGYIGLDITESAPQVFEIHYETPAPVMVIDDVGGSRYRIVVSSDTHYENITAIFSLPAEAPAESLGLFWFVNDTWLEMDDFDHMDLDNDTLIDSIQWTVSSLSDQTYEIRIDILNVHSNPPLGGNWTVFFDTVGTADLSISPVSGTTWSEFLADENSTADDLAFLDLGCGNVSLAEDILLIDENGEVFNYSALLDGTSMVVRSVLIEDYSCDYTGYITNLELFGGGHYLLFDFGGVNATAQNYVFELSCVVNDTGACGIGWTDVFHMSSANNSHAEVNNQSNYNHYVCCKEIYGDLLNTSCSDPKSEEVLRLANLTNAHVEKVSEHNYDHDICLTPTENYNISCTYSNSCQADETCVASISSTEMGSDTNLQVANCSGYTTKICCGPDDDTPVQPPSYENCIIPYDDYTVMQNVTFCPGVYHLIDVAGDGVIKLGVTGAPYNVSGNGTVIIGDDSGRGFFGSPDVREVIIKDITISDYQYGLYMTGADNVTLENITVNSSSSVGYYSWNPTYNVTVRDSTFRDNTYNLYFYYLQNSTFERNTIIDGTYAFTAWSYSNGNSYLYNNIISPSGRAFYMRLVSYSNFTGNNVSDGVYGIYETINPSGKNVWHDNRFDVDYGYRSAYAVYDSVFTNNTFNTTQYAIYLSDNGASNMTFYYNNFTAVSGYFVNVSSADVHFNTTVAGVAHGNYWSDISGLDIVDTDSDGFGDWGLDYPYNGTSTPEVSANVIDFGPITDLYCIDGDSDYAYAAGSDAECQRPRDCDDGDATLQPPYDNMKISADTSLCPGTYYANDTDADGLINFTADDVQATCAGTILIGDGTGYAFLFQDVTGTNVSGCNISDYDYGVYSTFPTSYNTGILNNTFPANDNQHVRYLASGTGHTIAGNSFYGSVIAGRQVDINIMGDSVISDNYFEIPPTHYGLDIGGADDNNFTGNVFNKTVDSGSQDSVELASGSQGNMFWRNRFYRRGINVGSRSSNPVSDNIFCVDDGSGLVGNAYLEGAGEDRPYGDCGPFPNLAGQTIVVNASADNGWVWRGSANGVDINFSNVGDAAANVPYYGLVNITVASGDMFGELELHGIDNVTVDCNNKGEIRATESYFSNVLELSDVRNVTVQNCTFDTGYKAGYLVQAYNSSIVNCTFDTTSSFGIDLSSSDHNIIENSRIYTETASRFINANSNSIHNCTIQESSNNEEGLYFYDGSSKDNNISYNVFYGSNRDVITFSGDPDNTGNMIWGNDFLVGWAWEMNSTPGNHWNYTDIGNFWSMNQSQGAGCTDLSPIDGVCDEDFQLTPGSDYDYHPRTHQFRVSPDCGEVLTGSLTLSSDLLNSSGGDICPQHGLILTENNQEIICGNHAIKGMGIGTTIGIALVGNVAGSNVTDCIMDSFGYGVELNSTSNSQVFNTTIQGSTIAGIMLAGNADNNNLTDILLADNALGVNISGSTGNIFWSNNFSNSTSYHAWTNTAGNEFNITNFAKAAGFRAEGNWWDDVSGLNIYDTDVDGFADFGIQYPYNSTNGGNVSGYVIDWGPITPKRCADDDEDGYGAIGSNLSNCTFKTYYDCDNSNASVVPPRDDLNMTDDTWICNGTYFINDSGSDGIINFKAGDIYLTCDRTLLIGNNSGAAFLSDSRAGISIIGCNASNYTYGVYLKAASGAIVRNNSFFNTAYGAYITGASAGNLFYYNTFLNSIAYHAFAGSSGNSFNTTVDGNAHGNYWGGVESLKIYDTRSDGFGDAGLQYPYSSAKSGQVNLNVSDWGPITGRDDYRISAPLVFQPSDDSIVTDSRNPVYGWINPEHTLSDSVSYEIQVDDDSDFSSLVLQQAGLSEGWIYSYYWNSSWLQFSTDYYWRVRANDGYNLSQWSSAFKFSILPNTACTSPVDEIDFGVMCIWDDPPRCASFGFGPHIDDTLDYDPPPYTIINDGNLRLNGTLYSTNLWESPTPEYSQMPGEYYQFMAGENESGAYGWAMDSGWFNMTNISSEAPILYHGLKWENVSDAFHLHIRLHTPSDEPPGGKYSTTYVSCEQNETY